ncbi:MAG: ribbon-helix-helix domain-containing protein [Acidobacteriota bacterium]|nr:ribbon-helix-helix domain-containing protein [Acidobacteriota bacterium]
MTPGGLNRVSTYLLPEEREAVRRRAFEQDDSISEVIRAAIRSYLDLP